jgi:hypothetical protein
MLFVLVHDCVQDTLLFIHSFSCLLRARPFLDDDVSV